MSCRRAHRRNFMACRYDSPDLSGCCHLLTCSYTRHKRIDQVEKDLPSYDPRRPQDRNQIPKDGRTGLQWRQCQYFYEPKLICAKRTCRRMVKPFYDPDMWDYHFGAFGSCRVTPNKDNNPAYVQAKKGWHERHVRMRRGTMTDRDRELNDWEEVYWKRGGWQPPHIVVYEKPSAEARAGMREASSDAWDEQIVYAIAGAAHIKRCPCCGDAVLAVGLTFRIAARRDEKGWNAIEKMIEEGDHLVAKFSYCMTFEEHDKTMQKLEDAKAAGLVK